MQRAWLVGAFVICAPAMLLVALGVHATPPLMAMAFGLAIIGAAFVLSWAAEVAEMDIPQALAVAILALVAVLPEYAVDLYFAWRAADEALLPAAQQHYVHYATANMTGSNRLLVGLGWPVVFLLFALRFRKKSVHLETSHRIEVLFLGLATVYSFVLPLKKSLSLVDTAVFLVLFGLYAWRVTKAEVHEPELVGPARLIGRLSRRPRRFACGLMFVFSAAVIYFAAEPFAESLIATGKQLQMDEFLLVQWVAPLASEAPEFILAAMLALRGRAAAGMTLLISSKVNQWTLLVGSLPVAYSISGTTFSPLDMEARQAEEVFLTAAQSLFAIAVLTSLSFSARESILIFVLFALQLAIPIPEVRLGFGAAYIVLALGWFASERREVVSLFGTARRAVLTPPEHSGRDPPPDTS